jgi:hypothetical protein
MRQLTMLSRAPAPSTGAVANPGWLSHDGAILGRRNTMREKLITATKPTSQNCRDHKSTPATINYSALQNVDLKDITDLSGMSKLG